MSLKIVDKLINFIDNTTASEEIPSSTHVSESVIVCAPINKVWDAVNSCTFEFSSAVKSSEIANASGAADVGGSRILRYSDGTTQVIELLERSNLQHEVQYCMVSSEPVVSYSSAYSRIKLTEVTCNVNTDTGAQTYMEWVTDFSNDATVSVIQDSKYKKREAFADLQTFCNHSK